MTDLELMQLLDEQGYEATLENLEILKEGLESGAYEIKNVATIEKKPSELTSDIDNEDVYDDEEHEQEEDVGEVVIESLSDYELYQLLEMEGYETTNENLEILKEGLYSGEIEILDEANAAVKNYKRTGKWSGTYYMADSVTAHENGKYNAEKKRKPQPGDYNPKRLMLAHYQYNQNPHKSNLLDVKDTGAHKGQENRETTRKKMKKEDEEYKRLGIET